MQTIPEEKCPVPHPSTILPCPLPSLPSLFCGSFQPSLGDGAFSRHRPLSNTDDLGQRSDIGELSAHGTSIADAATLITRRGRWRQTDAKQTKKVTLL